MKRKGLAVGIILLFVGTCIIPGIAQITEKQSPTRGNWLYVGGSGPGNYTKIQDAINNASDEDTVFVYDDSSPYHENLKVFNEISLFGEDKETTELRGFNPNDEVIVIFTPDYVTISGFTITTETSNIGIQIYTSYNTISGNIFTDNSSTFESSEIGVLLSSTSLSCTIKDNIFQNTSSGIKVYGSSFNMICNNSFLSNHDGIDVDNGIENTIANNIFMSAHGTGIEFSDSNSNKIIDNSISSYQWAGIWFQSDCSNNQILRNNISFCREGINFDATSDNNSIENNTIYGNSFGISHAPSCHYTLIKNNKVINNYCYGIWVGGSNNDVYFNVVDDNKEDGFRISGSNNKVHFNVVRNNKDVGIIVSGSNHNISYNMIENNGNGVYLENTRQTMITSNNFIDNDGYFLYDFKGHLTLHNTWNSNYWDSLKGETKIIIGNLKIHIFSFTWLYETYEIALYPKGFNFDWHPAQEPYDIPGMS